MHRSHNIEQYVHDNYDILCLEINPKENSYEKVLRYCAYVVEFEIVLGIDEVVYHIGYYYVRNQT